jgi:hypothetical protein
MLGNGRGGETQGSRRLVETAVFRHSPQDAEPLHINQQFSLLRFH